MKARPLTVEDRLTTMRSRSALLWAHLNALAERDAGQFPHMELDREGFQGFADVAAALVDDIRAVCAALDFDSSRRPTAGVDQ